jgi:hypothetical protein
MISASMVYSKLQLRILSVYKQFLRALNKTPNQQVSKEAVRQVFKENAQSIDKSNIFFIEQQLRLAERRLQSMKSVDRISTIKIRK